MEILKGNKRGFALLIGRNAQLGYLWVRARSRLAIALERFVDPESYAFYAKTIRHGYPGLIDILPHHRLIYVSIPKCASTAIRMTLSSLIGHKPASPDDVHKRNRSGLMGPRQVGPSTYFRLANDPTVLRFSFVRNPYDRLVSAWVDKFRHRPLAPGDSEEEIDQYLRHHRSVDPLLPKGPGQTLSFHDFVIYATATAHQGFNHHWELQDHIVSVPGLELNLIGKVETFNSDFIRVLEHVNANEELRRSAIMPVRRSRRGPYEGYYTSDLAARVYRTYERDFDRFGYPRDQSG